MGQRKFRDPLRSHPAPGRARAEGEEMSAPEFPWTPEEDGLLRSMGAAGESTAAIATLLKRTPDAVRQRARLLEIKLARSPPGEGEGEMPPKRQRLPNGIFGGS